jgi:hypothetical protein
MTTTLPDTPHSGPATEPLALKLTEGLGPLPTSAEDEAVVLARLSKTPAEAYERGYVDGAARERERCARTPLTEGQIDDMLGEANRGFCIERDDYIKAVRDAEHAHGIGPNKG